MSALALKLAPGAAPSLPPIWADRWERLLDRSHRPVEARRTLLPDLAAVQVSTGFFRDRPQPAVSADGGVYLWLDGEVSDRAGAGGCLGGGDSAAGETTAA